MKNINLFLISCLSVFLVSCGGGNATDRQDIDKLNAYGNLLSSEDISNVKTSDLQSAVKEIGVCPNIDASSPYSATQSLCEKNTSYINANPNIFINKGQSNLENFVTNAGVSDIDAFKILYNTPGQTSNFSGGSPTNEKVSGLVLVPNFSDPSIKFKGIILYYHPSVVDKNSVPSAYFNLNNLKSYPTSITAYNLATVFASQGYVVVAPDYVGQGDNYNVLHPYAVYPQVNALSGIYMLNAARKLLTTYASNLPNDKLHLYISSYSEGAPYALWASRFLQGEYAGILNKNNLDLKRTIGISGAYNLSGRQMQFAYSTISNSEDPAKNNYNVSPGLLYNDPILKYHPDFYPQSVGLANFNMASSKVVLGSYAFTTFIHYNYSGSESIYETLFKSSTRFLKMDKCLIISKYLTSNDAIDIGDYCPYKSDLEGLFTNNTYTQNDIMNQLISSGMGSHNDGNSNYFTSGLQFNKVVENLLNGTPTNNSIGVTVNDLPENILAEIRKADTYNFTTSSPLTLVYMKYDSTVTNLSSTDAFDSIKSAGGVGLVRSVPIDNTNLYSVFSKNAQIPMYLEHTDAEFVLNLVALAEINKDESNGK